MIYNPFESDLFELRKKHSLLTVRDCTEEETNEIDRCKSEGIALPAGAIKNEQWEDGESKTVYRMATETLDSSYEDRIEYIMLMQTEQLSAIRKMLLFFAVLTCIGLAAGLISMLVMFSA